jgi:hypothetical protein
MKDPILITGIERSGSSIVAKIIHMCGAFRGNVNEMQENRHIKEFVNHFYNYHNVDPRGQYPLPENEYIPIPPYWSFKIETLLDKEGYNEAIPWMYKSSRIAQIWPIWNLSYPKAKWIVVRRRTGDIIQSCIKTGFMTAYADQSVLQQINAKDEADGWLWWVHEHERMFSDMSEAGIQFKEVWPERMAAGDFEQMKELISWLGLEWNEKIPEFVRPLLRNSKQKERV